MAVPHEAGPAGGGDHDEPLGTPLRSPEPHTERHTHALQSR